MADKLQINVDFAAIDRITGPIKKMMDGSKGLASAVKEAKDRLKELDRAQQNIDGFRKLSKDAAITSNQLKAAQDRVKGLAQAMEQAGNPTKKMTREFEAAKKAAGELKQKSQALDAALQASRSRLDATGISTRNLSQAQRELKGQTEAAAAALKKQEDALARVNARLKAQHAARAQYEKGMGQRNKLAGAGAELGIAGAVVGAPIVRMVKDYGSFEDAMLGVAKQVEGARDENGRLTQTYFDLGDSIKAMATRIPMATTELAALVEAGARMGVQGKENLLKFTETTAITATAFDLPVEQVGEQMGKLSNLFKIPIANIGQLGDVINYLDDNALSKGGDIINVMQRIAGTAATVNMGFKDAAALGSTFLTLGATAEIAATASNAMIRELAIANMQPKRFQAGMKELGLSSAQVQAQMSKDATGTIQKVLVAINKLPKSKQLEVTTQLFGKEYGDDAAKLANNLEEYRRQLRLTQDMKATGSMMRESGAKNDTLSAQSQMGQNRLFNLSAELGANLRQPLMEVMNLTGDVLGRVNAWVKANPALAATLVKVGAGLSIVLTVLGALSLALAAFLGPMVIARYGLAMLGIQFGKFGPAGALLGMVLRGVGTALLFVARLAMANPLIAAVSLIAMGAVYIWQNWGTLGPKFAALWAGIKSAMVGAWTGITGYLSGLAGQMMGIGAQIIDGLREGIMSRVAAVREAVAGVANSVAAAARGALGIHSPSRVFAAIGAHTVAGLNQGLAANQDSPIGTVTHLARKISKAGAGIAIDTGRALAANLDTRPPLRGAAQAGIAGGGGIGQVVINVYAAPGQSAAEIGQVVEAKLRQLQGEAAARGRSRLSDRE